MIKNKIDLEHAFSKLKGKIITSVWYKGKFNIRSDYQTNEEGLFLECSDGDVFHIYPADELNLKFIYGVYIKQMNYWERERKYIKHLKNVTVEWKDYIGKEIQAIWLNWERIINHKFSRGHPKSRTDYPYSLELHFDNREHVYLEAMKIVDEETKPYLGYPEITVFFDSKIRDRYINLQEE